MKRCDLHATGIEAIQHSSCQWSALLGPNLPNMISPTPEPMTTDKIHQMLKVIATSLELDGSDEHGGEGVQHT